MLWIDFEDEHPVLAFALCYVAGFAAFGLLGLIVWIIQNL